ncbi:hypothetical protein [Yersinia sp. Marseille-Q3913]|uniref:hypothetical protein n=1 Tax=Yersinia sp. Marseille-Q3913 TaxID=2830769 RepID=UPI001BAF1DA4|nr:hypothetical protein [Yersinia sp. Marseille-Q3913]MBS0057670.1 hypothetical protein [Yersinia sp. Marseille-Q3913]
MADITPQHFFLAESLCAVLLSLVVIVMMNSSPPTAGYCSCDVTPRLMPSVKVWHWLR